MVEMKSVKVVLSLAAQLASWRAVLVLLRTRATCKPWQRKDFHQDSIFLADCLNQSKQTVCESAGAAAATESRKVGKGRRKRRYAYVDRPGAKPEPELGPRGPTLKKQVLKGSDWLDVRLGLQLADSVDITQDFEWTQDSDSSGWGFPVEQCGYYGEDMEECQWVLTTSEAMDPEGSPSSIPKVADTARPSSSPPSAATVPGWRSFFCLGNGK